MNINRFLKYINYCIALAVLAALGVAYWFGWRVLPRTSGTVEAPIAARGKVTRDSMGVPHIEAASAEDAWFLQGYVTAQDRLFQMEVTRRQAAGELAAIFGPAALENDIEMRRLRMRRLAIQHERLLPSTDRAVMAAYARGVNYYLKTHQDRLPVEFTLIGFDPAPWTIADTILVGLQMFRSLSTTWKDEAQKSSFMAQGEPDKVHFLFPARTGSEPQMGSNAWVLSGKRTATGKPILANDPHLAFSLPGIWYQVHIKSPEMNVTGASIPGAPAVIIGHNERIGWGVTNLHFDVQDLYREQVNLNAGLYLYRGQPQRLLQEREVVRLRDGRRQEVAVVSTRHGPLLGSEGAQPLALRWVAAELGIFEFPFGELNRAHDWAEFRTALRRYPGPGQNFLYADVDGNIGYQAAGKLPIRKDWDGDLPVDGSSGNQEWSGFIPFDQLPSTYNPDSGLIITANQNPFPPDFPHRLNGNFAPPYRAAQIRALLEAKPNGWRPADMLVVQKDVYSAFLHFLARGIAAAYKRRGMKNPWLSEAVETLEKWNGQMEKGTAAPMVATLAFQELRKAAADRASPGKGSVYELQMAPAVLEQLLCQRPKDWFTDYDQLLLSSLMDGVREGAKLQGENVSKWDYGSYNELLLKNPVLGDVPFVGRYFRIGPAPMSGASTTVKQTTRRLGPSMRMVLDAGDWDRSLMNVVTGQSGQPLSGHYRDQWESYYRGDSFPMRFKNVEGDTLEFVPMGAGR